MKALYETSQFRKDLKRLKKQGKQIQKLKDVVRRIAGDEDMEIRHRDHALTGR